MKANKLRGILEHMQGIDPNGDWRDATLDKDTLEAMLTTLNNWHKDLQHDTDSIEFRHVDHLMYEMESMYDTVYESIWEEEDITELDWDIFLTQAGRVDLIWHNRAMWVVLGNVQRKVNIITEAMRRARASKHSQLLNEVAIKLSELAEAMGNDYDLNDDIATLDIFKMSVDEAACELWGLAESMKRNFK